MSSGPRRAPSPARQRRWWLALFPLVVAGVIAVLAVAAHQVGRDDLRRAERVLLDDRAALVARLGSTGLAFYSSNALQALVDDAGFTPDNLLLDGLLLGTFSVGPAGDPYRTVGLLDTEGRVLVARPEGRQVDTASLGDAWALATTGTGGLSPVFEHDGRAVWARTLPVGDPPWAVLVLVEDLEDGWLQDLYEGLAAEQRTGGLSLVTDEGVVAASWDPALVGRHHPAADRFASLGGGVTTLDDGDTVRIAYHAAIGGTTLVFEQERADLFAGLRRAQAARDRSLSIVIGVAVLAVVAASVARHRAARAAKARTSALLDQAQDVLVVVGERDEVRFASPPISRLLGWEPGRWHGRPVSGLAHGDDAARLAGVLDQCRRDGASSVRGVLLRHGGGGTGWFDVDVVDLRHQREVRGLLLTCHDVSRRQRLAAELAHRADHDPLTGLGNRTRFRRALVGAAHDPDGMAVLALDLDRFKLVNDAFGHAAGDATLRTVAARLRDAVGEDGVLCRMGGDEFTVVTAGMPRAGVDALADRLLAAVSSVTPHHGAGGLDLGVSVGIAQASGPTATPDLLARHADAAMYLAKQHGGGRAVRHPSSPAPAAPESAPTAAGPPAPTVAPPPPPRRPAGGRRRSWRAAALHSLPVLLAAAGLVGVGSAAREHSARGREEAERTRLEDRARLVEDVARLATTMADPGRLVPMAAEAPWTLDGSVVDQAIIDEFASSPAFGTGATAALVAPDGRVLVRAPAGAEVLLPDALAHRTVLGGAATASGVQRHADGTPRLVWYVPVARGGTTAAVLVIDLSLRTAAWSTLTPSIGSFGRGPGGLSTVDPNGVATASWDRSLVGEAIVDPAHLEGLVPGTTRILAEDGQVEILAALVDGSGYAEVWQQDELGLFGDLRAGGHDADRVLIAVTGGCLLVLLAGAWARERAVRAQWSRLDALLQHAHDVLLDIGRDDRVRFASSALATRLGRHPSRTVGQRYDEVVDPADTSGRRALAAAIAAARGGIPGSVAGVRFTTAAGHRRVFDVEVTDVRRGRRVRSVLLTCHDVQERHDVEAELRRQATSDELTGLANRSVFGDRLDELTDAAGGLPCAVVFVDLDRFKAVNDELGHPAGDEVLRVTARRLERAVRAGDLVCRLGGDEFAIVLVGADEALASQIARRVLDAAGRPMAIDGRTLRLGASVGVALADPRAVPLERLLRRADQAMYEAKERGRGRLVVHP